jgi:hypothetical protein
VQNIGRPLPAYLVLPKQIAALVPNGNSGNVHIFLDSEDGALKMKDENGHITVFLSDYTIIPSTGGGDVDEPTNKDMPCLFTFNDGDLACATGLTHDPRPDSAITITVNGVEIGPIGFNSKVGAAVYFSNTNGLTASSREDLMVGTRVYWQGSIAGWQLETADVMSIFYTVGT